MRSSNLVRFALSALSLLLAVIAGALVTVSASAAATATPEPTLNPAMSLMIKEAGACPAGSAKTILDTMMNMPEMPTEEAMTPEATSEATQEVETGVKCLIGEFNGGAEVPGPGEKDASGIVMLSVHGSTGNVCFEVAVANMTLPATDLYVEQGAAGSAGTMAISLRPKPDQNGLASGCATAGVKLATEIENHPSDYAVDVYMSDFPKGAARAQLMDYSASTISMTPEATESMSMTPEATAQS